MAGRSSTGIYVALLRAINVGGNRILPMKALAAIFEEAGCADVRTYIQSGNVVYRASAALARKVPALVSEAIDARFGFDVPIVTRTAAELAAVVKSNPLLKRDVDTKRLHVGFLLRAPSKTSIAALDPGRSPGDAFVVRGAEIYLHTPNGMGRSKLTTQYLDSALGTTVTVRNWNTVLKLHEMTG